MSSSQVRAVDEEHEYDDTPGKTYGVIVDCGSSGTRANIFEWDSSIEYPELLHNIEPMRDEKGRPVTKKITPGLSSLRDNPNDASKYMEPIINFISENIPSESYKSTGIYIMGTAGMRLLDKETQLQIMDDIIRDLRVESKFAKVRTSVISGQSEGMYQWITVNSKAKRFVGTNSNSKVETYAVIEMGGASIQVTYQLLPGMGSSISNLLSNGGSEALEAYKRQIVVPEISREADEYNYKLVSTTFLGLGSNSAREAYVDLLVKKADRSYHKWYNWGKRLFNTSFKNLTKKKPLVLKDPCLPTGAKEVVERPTRMFADQTQTVGFTIDDDDTTYDVKLIGSGQYSTCRRYLKEMLITAKNERMNCEPDEACTMSLLGTPFVPFYSYEFLGIGDFYYTTNEMLNLAGSYDRNKIVRKTKEICETDYSKLLRLYPEANQHDESRIRRECFKATFMEAFLGYGLEMPEEYGQFKTVGEVGGDPPMWALGAILDKAMAVELSTGR